MFDIISPLDFLIQWICLCLAPASSWRESNCRKLMVRVPVVVAHIDMIAKVVPEIAGSPNF